MEEFWASSIISNLVCLYLAVAKEEQYSNGSRHAPFYSYFTHLYMTEAQEMHAIHRIVNCSCLFRVDIFISFWCQQHKRYSRHPIQIWCRVPGKSLSTPAPSRQNRNDL